MQKRVDGFCLKVSISFSTSSIATHKVLSLGFLFEVADILAVKGQSPLRFLSLLGCCFVFISRLIVTLNSSTTRGYWTRSRIRSCTCPLPVGLRRTKVISRTSSVFIHRNCEVLFDAIPAVVIALALQVAIPHLHSPQLVIHPSTFAHTSLFLPLRLGYTSRFHHHWQPFAPGSFRLLTLTTRHQIFNIPFLLPLKLYVSTTFMISMRATAPSDDVPVPTPWPS